MSIQSLYALLTTTEKAYNPQQARWSKGNPKGGQWKPTGAIRSERELVPIVARVALSHGGGDVFGSVIRAIAAVHSLHSTYEAVEVRVVRGSKTSNGGYAHGPNKSPKILLNKSSPDPELTALHEFGHYIDDQIGKQLGLNYLGSGGYTYNAMYSAVTKTKTFKKWNLIASTNKYTHKGIIYDGGKDKYFSRYALHQISRSEIWANAYTQHIARRAAKTSPKLYMTFRINQKHPLTRFWSDKEFEAVDREVEAILKANGLE
jgi:hypothetical protein